MKIYEMLQALAVVNQLNNAIGQNENGLKFYISRTTSKEDEEKNFTITALSLSEFYKKANSMLTNETAKIIATSEYENEIITKSVYETSTTGNIEKVNYSVEVYMCYDWECEEW